METKKYGKYTSKKANIYVQNVEINVSIIVNKVIKLWQKEDINQLKCQ
jgi:hypothetical protein